MPLMTVSALVLISLIVVDAQYPPLLPPTPIGQSIGVGEEGWSYYRGYCYRLVVDKANGGINQTAAERKCADLDSQLASIHSEGENRFLYQLGFTGCTMLQVDGKSQGLPYPAEGAYIGIRRRINPDKSGFCEWTDGTVMDYGREVCEHPPSTPGALHRPWGDAQPDNNFPPEECGFMVHTGGPSRADTQWGDIACRIKFAAVFCKKPCYTPCEAY